jgi:MFS family permease
MTESALLTAPASRGRHWQLVLLVTAMAIGAYLRTAISPLQEAIRISLALSDNQVAVLQGPIIGVPVSLTAIPIGMLIDRYSRSKLLCILMALSLTGSLLTAFVTGFPLLLFARAMAGIAAVSILAVVFASLSDLYEPHLRGRVTMAAVIGQVVGNAAAFAIGGKLLVLYGGALHWRSAMFALVAPVIPVSLCLLALRDAKRNDSLVEFPTVRQIWRTLEHQRVRLGLLTAGIIFIEIAIGAILIWAAPMLSRRFNLPADAVGSALALVMLLSGLLGPALGGIIADASQKVGGPNKTVGILACLSFVTIVPGCFAFLPAASLSTVALIIEMTLLLSSAIAGLAVFTIVIPAELRGICISILMALELLFAYAVAPVSVSLLSVILGGGQMIGMSLSIVCMLCSVLAAIMFFSGGVYLPFDLRHTKEGSRRGN